MIVYEKGAYSSVKYQYIMRAPRLNHSAFGLLRWIYSPSLYTDGINYTKTNTKYKRNYLTPYDRFASVRKTINWGQIDTIGNNAIHTG